MRITNDPRPPKVSFAGVDAAISFRPELWYVLVQDRTKKQTIAT
jgi:hypothetical protein